MPRILRGLLGWSNKRNGVEFYRYDPKVIPRHGSEWGDLLVQDEELDRSEGSPVLVIVFARQTSEQQLAAAEALVRHALATP